MKVFKILSLVCFFFFVIGCDEGPQRFIPIDEPDDGSSDVTDDEDNPDTENPDTTDTDNPVDDSDTADTDNPVDDGDTTDTDNPVDDSDTTDTDNPVDDSDNSDTVPSDNDSTDTGTDTDNLVDDGDSEPDADNDDADTVPSDNDNTDTDTDTDNPVDDGDSDIPETDEEKCAAAGGTWDEFAEDEMERCYKIVDCDPKPEHTEWRGEQSWIEYYDVEDNQWTNFGQNYDTEYNDSGDEPKFCQYICAANTLREDNECKPICSAVFNGSSSRITVSNNSKLNLGNTWTIEAWVKQDAVTTKIPAIVRKGGTRSISYYLTAVYQTREMMNTYNTMTGGFYYNSSSNPFAATVGSNDDFDDAWKDGWNHVALSYYTTEEGTGAISIMKKAHIRLYVNGKMITEDTEPVITSMTPNTVSDGLAIGYDSQRNTYFNGKIDQLKISTNTYESDFTPSELSKDGNTVVFYDFSNNANDSSDNGLNGMGTNVTYSTDCAF